jgi:hypothetical protein
MAVGSTGGSPSQNPWNETQAQPSTSYYESHSVMTQQVQNLYDGHGHGFYQNPIQQPNFS